MGGCLPAEDTLQFRNLLHGGYNSPISSIFCPLIHRIDYRVPDYQTVDESQVRRFTTVKEASEFFTPRWRDRLASSSLVGT
jgi:hypothetical protein